MDLALNPTTTKSAHEKKLLSFTNAAFSHHHHPTPPPSAPGYKECMKNHAAAVGGHAVDGCGEFMTSPSDPTSLKRATCGCHRNFHRCEPDSPTTPITPPFLNFRHPPLPIRSSLSPSTPSPPVLYPSQRLIAFNTAAVVAEDHHRATPIGENPARKKRFGTKFSKEQKEKMQYFSEKLGRKMQKCDEASIEEFCNGIGVAKGVLKVWMHNNKNTIGKKEMGSSVSIVNGGII